MFSSVRSVRRARGIEAYGKRHAPLHLLWKIPVQRAYLSIDGIYGPRDQGEQATVHSCDDFGYR